MLIKLCQALGCQAPHKFSLVKQLRELAKSSDSELASVAGSVADQLQSGRPFIDSLGLAHATQRNELAACIRVGEATDQLSVTLRQWATMQTANTESERALRAALIYPVGLVMTTWISITWASWRLIPEIAKTYSLFFQDFPTWILWLLFLRQQIWWLGILIVGSMVLPTALWFRKQLPLRSGTTLGGFRRLRLEALCIRLTQLQIVAHRPVKEILENCISNTVPEQCADDENLTGLILDQYISHLPTEARMLLHFVESGLLSPSDTAEELGQLASLIECHANDASDRNVRFLPMLVSIIVGVVVLIAYIGLIYLPWVMLLTRIGEEAGS